ncbi:hypothetical protein ACF0H5_002171 [Mactra antiquata]
MVVKNAVSLLRPVAQNQIIRRNFSYGPPRNPMSTQSKAFYASISTFIVAAPNIWIVSHMRKYMGKE